MRAAMPQLPARVPRLLTPLSLALALLAGARAQVPPGPGRPAAALIENAVPRATGNSFVAHWSAEDFGGGSGNTTIVQHPATGFIYVGNSQGVLEFDGARWQLVPLRHSGAVLALAIDARGGVWAASENEIARLEPDAAGALHAVSVVHPLPEGEEGAIDQAVLAGDAVWFRGLQHIVRIGRDGRTATWRTGERFGRVWWMDGALHTTISDREVARLEEGGGLTTILSRDAVRVPPSRPSPFRVFVARRLNDGDWLLLTALGPARWRSDAKTWRPFAMRPALFREAEAIAATFLDDGAMVFVTARPGGIVIQPDGRVERLLDRMPAVMNPRINEILADHEGGLWVTSRDHIARLQVRSAFARHEGAQGLQGNPRQLLRHGERLLLAHTSGVSHYLEWPGAFPPADGLHRGADALTVAGDRVYAAAKGLVEIIDGGATTRTWSNLAITTVTGVRGVPDLLLGGDAGGVWSFRLRAGDWRSEGRIQNLTGSVTTLFDRGDGTVWGALTDGRLWHADFRGEGPAAAPRSEPRVTFYGPAQGVPTPARGGKINFFALGSTTVATCGSWLLQHNPAAGRFDPETRIAGLAGADSRGAEAIGPGAGGAWWVRLAAPDRRLLRVAADGPGRWRAEEVFAPAIRDLAAVSLFEDHGTLWVAGKDTLVSIDLDWKPGRPLPPLGARIRRVITDQGLAVWRDRGGGGDAGQDAERPAALQLPTGESSVRFEFAAAAFMNDHRGRPTVRYRTRLDGLERQWSVWSAEPWRDFTRLPAGNYTFRVQASDQAGRTSAEATLPLLITAPWWRTRGAWAGYAAAAGLMMFGVIALRTRTLRRRAQRLEATVAARTEELRRSNAELARLHRLELDEKAAARLAEEEARLEVLRYQLNPHFLYNALNSIYSLVLTAPPAAANMVLRLSDFCRVALDRRQEENTTVGAEFDKLSIYLEIEKARWGDTLHISVEADENARHATLPPFLLLPLVENAMKYGSATSAEELHVGVSARITDAGMLELTVANTGEWLKRTSANTPFSGIGLTNLRQRLQRYHPNAHEVIIQAEGGWVRVTLQLPSSDCRVVVEKAAAAAAAPEA